MTKENSFKIMKVLGVVIMLISFPIIPKAYPWYYQIILFNIGLILLLVTIWSKIKEELGISK